MRRLARTQRWAVVVGGLLLASAIPAAADEEKAVAILSNHTMISITGDVIDPDPAVPELRTESAKAAVQNSNSFLLPAVGLKKAIGHEAEITSCLDDLFDNWAGASEKYGTYLVLLPAKIDIKSNAASVLLGKPHDTILALRPYALHNHRAAVKTLVPATIAEVDLFKTPLSPPKSPAPVSDPADAVFVHLDGFDAAVPVGVANLMETNFLNGFVTRLVLGSYVAFWEKTGNAVPSAMHLSLGAMKPRPGLLGLFAMPGTYPAGSTLADDIAGVIAKDPINAMAIMWGWNAADELVALDHTADHRYIRDAWELISYRFSFRGVGDIVAFTINYLAGGAHNERVRAIAAGQNPPPVSDIAFLYAALTNNGHETRAKEFSVALEDIMFSEFYAITQNNSPGLAVEQRRALVTQYADFLTGYRKGESRSADALYEEAGGLTFGLAYPTGVQDGYALGFTEGLRDGYASDYAENWKQADVVVTDLQRQVTTLEAKLRGASIAGGAGFWDQLGTMKDPRDSFIGAIAAFY